MRRTFLFCTVIVVPAMCALGVSPTFGVGVSDDFEDGNTTVNPAWFDANPGYGENGGIVVDPVRPDNHVWEARSNPSTPGAHGRIATTDFTPMQWEGFHASVDILRTAAGFNGDLGVDNFGAGWAGDGFELDFGGNGWFSIFESVQGVWTEYPMPWDLSQVPADTWLQARLWHDPATGLVKADLRRLSDGYVFVQNSIIPTSLGGDSMINRLVIGAGSRWMSPGSWNYLDNASLAPEPASLSLLALGGLVVMRRRRR